MSSIADIYNQIAELRKQRMEITFTPVSNRDKSFITQLRTIKAKIAALKREAAKISEDKRGGK